MATKSRTYRLPELTVRQIADLRQTMGCASDAQVVILSLDRMIQERNKGYPTAFGCVGYDNRNLDKKGASDG